MLVLLESLSPEQRAVLLLHDVFDYESDLRNPRDGGPLAGRPPEGFERQRAGGEIDEE